MSVLAVTVSFLAIFVTIVLMILGKFIDVLTAPTTFKFLFNLSSSIKDLEAARETLRAAKEATVEKIADAKRQSKIPTSQVEGWMKDVDKIMTDIEGVVDKYNRCGDKRAFSYIYSMYSVATECAEYHQRVKDLLTSDRFATSYEVPRFATAYEVPGSLELKYNKVLEFLKTDNSVNVVGIWGMGGVGKTTLLQKIYHSCIGSPDFQHFQHVIYITASNENSNVSKLQREIVKKLRLEENGDPHTTINNYLRNKNFILFIDDLWKAVDLTEVGVSDTSSEDPYKRKVVITTREKNVCGKMEARKIIEVECLDPKQSLILFTKKVGEEVIKSHPLIPKLAEDIVKECQGLPLALITIGRAMSMKSNIGDWKHILNQLKKSKGLHDLDAEKRLLHRLKISYDNLATDQLRKCFLTISMWPEDEIIDPEEIIEFWMGIDLMDVDNYESKHELYQFGLSLIGSLQAACLLEDFQTDEYGYSFKRVKMHDILRDLALWLASDCGENENKRMVNAGIQLQNASNTKAKWSEAECISIIGSDIVMIPSDIPNCPSLLTLVLKSNRLTGEHAFCKFKSLTHLDLSNNSLECFSESICNLTELRYLNLSRNRITSLPMELRNLKALRYLILRENRIINIPRGVFAELVELLVLDMFRADVFGSSVDVEELKSIGKKLTSFGTSVDSEEELRKLMLLSELPIDDLHINGLHSRTFHFMSMIRKPHRLKVLCIDDEFSDDGSEISDGEISDGGSEIIDSEISDGGSEISDGEISDGGSEISDSEISDGGIRDGGSEMSDGGLMEIVFDKNETDQGIASLNLELLSLSDLAKIKRIIWKDIAPEILFAVLRKVQILRCRLLEDITWVVNLPSLEYLSIVGCERMRIAFSFNNDVDPQVLTFPSLEFFKLEDLYELEKVSTHSLALPKLRRMIIGCCPLLKALPLEVKTTPELKQIKGNKEWWEKVEWEDENSSSHFNQFFQRR